MKYLISAAALCFCLQPVRAESVYLAMGDSIGFGFTRLVDLEPTYADQGYVRRYAGWLGSQSGARPQVVNLSIPQESSASFFVGGLPATIANLNYPSATTSQSSLMASVIAQHHSLGNTIDHITIALGTNDLLVLGDDPTFLAAPPQEQATRVLDVLVAVGANLNTILDAIVAQAPEAEIGIPGYYNPYAAVPGHPLATVAPLAVQALNEVLLIVAEQHNARFVDIYSAFDGREGELTYMLTDSPVGSNFHPTPDGYRVFASAMIPTPGIMPLLAIGMTMVTRRRRVAGR